MYFCQKRSALSFIFLRVERWAACTQALACRGPCQGPEPWSSAAQDCVFPGRSCGEQPPTEPLPGSVWSAALLRSVSCPCASSLAIEFVFTLQISFAKFIIYHKYMPLRSSIFCNSTSLLLFDLFSIPINAYLFLHSSATNGKSEAITADVNLK